jgi:hypothetical protein
MKSLEQLVADLRSVDDQLTKVQGEVAQPARTFAITSTQGVFADDTNISIGDLCTVTVVRGRIGQLNTDGVWNDIVPGTIVEYFITHNGVPSNKTVEVFYGV